jgi:hypothetical protein
MRKTVVKTYTRRGAMQRGIERMVRRGYEVQQHSGEFSNPFTFRWNRRKVVVVFVQNF